MKIYTIYNAFFGAFVAVLCLSSCQSSKQVAKKNDKTSKPEPIAILDSCKTSGKVVDFSNIDGCNYFIQLPDSTFLQPVENGVEGFRLEPNQVLKFDYETLAGMMSICSVKSKPIKLTCANVLNEAQLKLDNPEVFIECFDVNIPNEAPWLKKILMQTKPNNVVKYSYFYNEKAYIISYGNKSILHDCRGIEIFKGDNRACQKLVVDTKSAQVIYQSEGVPE